MHIVKVNFPGGIVSSGDLLSIARAALAAGLQGLRFGGRQQLLMEVYSDKLEQLTAALNDAALFFEVDTDAHPNIMSACVAEQIVYTSGWLREGVYKDVLDSFDYRTRLAVNLVDQGQSFVPQNTGQLNYIASGIGNYWHLLLRVSPEGPLQEWKSLVYSGNIPRLTRRLEEFLLDSKHPPADQTVERMYADIMHSEQWLEQPPQEKLSFPDFALPYYEGFNRYLDRLWLGIYRRDELFAPAFLVDLCMLCLQTKVAQLYTTPWKSLVIQGIRPGDRKRWDIVLGRHGINVRHALSELSWQIEDISDEGLSLKHYLVRQFDRDDIRTFGLCFAIQLQPGPRPFGLILIRKRPGRKGARSKTLGRYEILYKKDFNAYSDDYVLFRKDVEKDQLAPYLRSLCKYFYECKAGEDLILHHVYRQKEDPFPTPSGTSIADISEVYHCIHCLTVYDPALGDPEAEIPAGTSLNALDNYTCPVCGSDRSAFVPGKDEPALFPGQPAIEYFEFEKDFIENDLRCIPMVVRFNLDLAGIKLKLEQWGQFSAAERIELATKPCGSTDQVSAYKTYLAGLIRKRTGKDATLIEVDGKPFWRHTDHVPDLLQEKNREFGWNISVQQWKSLTPLQRFALLKLCRPGHENKNFPKAIKEFSLNQGLH